LRGDGCYNAVQGEGLLSGGLEQWSPKSGARDDSMGIETKAVPLHVMEGLGWRYSSYSFSTSTLDKDEWSASRPGRALAPGKGPRYPLDTRLGGPQSWSGHRG
jgi:hypothetical protein